MSAGAADDFRVVAGGEFFILALNGHGDGHRR